MKNYKNTILNSSYVLVGLVLFVLGIFEIVDSFWSGMGSALCAIGVIRLLRNYRINKNDEYREKLEIELTDERNCFIRNKAWAWSGYLYVMLSSVGAIVCKIAGNDMLSIYCGFSTCVVISLYWLSYIWLRKKY